MQIARLAALLILGSALMAQASDKNKTKHQDKPTFHASKTETVTSKVKAVDQKTRRRRALKVMLPVIWNRLEFPRST